MRDDYYYHLYVLHYPNTECSSEDFQAYVEKVKELKVVFEDLLFRQWLVYLVIILLGDFYMFFTNSVLIYKY
jgi:hypothetical protein